jgi:hypothetical protein
MLGLVEAQQARRVAAQQRTRRDHLGVEPRVRRNEPQQIAQMTIRPIHHRRYREAAIERRAAIRSWSVLATREHFESLLE